QQFVRQRVLPHQERAQFSGDHERLKRLDRPEQAGDAFVRLHLNVQGADVVRWGAGTGAWRINIELQRLSGAVWGGFGARRADFKNNDIGNVHKKHLLKSVGCVGMTCKGTTCRAPTIHHPNHKGEDCASPLDGSDILQEVYAPSGSAGCGVGKTVCPLDDCDDGRCNCSASPSYGGQLGSSAISSPGKMRPGFSSALDSPRQEGDTSNRAPI